MNRLILILVLTLSFNLSFGQKKILDHESFDLWKNIQNETISADGKWVTYVLESNGEGNPELLLVDSKGNTTLSYLRGDDPKFTHDSNYLIFTIKPDLEQVKELKRIKTEKDEMPMDSLAIYNLANSELEKIPFLNSVKIPEKWSGIIAYQVDNSRLDQSEDEDGKESEEKEEESEKKKKKKPKNNKENGYTLVVNALENNQVKSYPYITDYHFAEEEPSLMFVSTGKDSLFAAGVYHFDPGQLAENQIHEGEGKYEQMAINSEGDQIAFMVDHDTTKVQIRPYELHHWQKGMEASEMILDHKSDFLNEGWVLGSKEIIEFSKDGSKLFFGISPPPILEDTTLLEEEIVNVEVWSYNDQKLHTQQKIDADDDGNRAYKVVYHVGDKNMVRIGTEAVPDIKLGNEGNADVALGENMEEYYIYHSWEGFPDYRDLYVVDVRSGKANKIIEKMRGSARLSPNAEYVYWYDVIDSAWFTYSVETEKINQITNNNTVPYYDELNDSPDFPRPYGVMSWTEGDEKVLIYDRYDIWEIDPSGSTSPVNLTQTGRDNEITYRYIRLDDEERFIKSGQKLMLRAFNEKDKSEAIIEYAYGKGNMKELKSGNYRFTNVQKAEDEDVLIYSFENFEIFPDLYLTDLGFKKEVRVSNANPQQSEYNWGTAELYSWISLDGKELEGLLIKPEDFDPTKKYPMIVNFYETSSNGLNRHRAPSPGRSTINYSFYTSRGYVIFNPNVHYRIGYPGESAYNCVIPGVTSLVEKGFIDKDNIGVQGHSWGGYQIAYLVTQTDIFKAAEAGAPVPNMVSAYGGIRWWTGLSRMFQYEHTQSRIGGTLWEYPLRYIENSPIFFVDKINTPLLLMHNDADGHVPWYQGIELFVSLRRLGKPAWMLNYQGEPHWPLKLQNRKDFNVRLQQFFDYYLKGAPMPKWMDEGVPATQVGIEQNLELMPADKDEGKR